MTIYTFGHNFPYTDCDSVISSILLSKTLCSLNVDAKPVLLNKDGLQPTTLNIFNNIPKFVIPDLIGVDELALGEFAIVDHNNPMESYGALGLTKEPIYCLDHHDDMNLIVCNNKRIKKTGSCATVLAEFIENTIVNISDEDATALVFAILCDTKCLKSRKTSNLDKQTLSKLFKTNNILLSRESIIEIILNSTDIESMTTEQITNNSLKEFFDKSVGISTFEVNNSGYINKLPVILDECWEKPYEKFLFVVYENHTQKTIIHTFDKTSGLYLKNDYNRILSRSRDIVPQLMSTYS